MPGEQPRRTGHSVPTRSRKISFSSGGLADGAWQWNGAGGCPLRAVRADVPPRNGAGRAAAMERGGRPQWSGAGGCRSKLSQLLGPFISFPRAGTGGACNGWSKRMPGVHGRLRAAGRRGSVVLIIIEQCPTCLKPDSDPLSLGPGGVLKTTQCSNNMLLWHQLQ